MVHGRGRRRVEACVLAHEEAKKRQQNQQDQHIKKASHGGLS
jgi:hypothetical protein